MRNKKGQSTISFNLLLAMSVLLFGSLGIALWSFGIALNNINSIWIGKIIIGTISIIVLIIERFLK